MSEIRITDVAETDPILSSGVSNRQLVGREQGAKDFSFSITTMDTGLDDPEVCDPDCDEVIYILSGTVELTEGGHTHILRKGKAIFIPRGQTYGYKVIHGPNEVVAVVSSARL